jgi:hypothetical protein
MDDWQQHLIDETEVIIGQIKKSCGHENKSGDLPCPVCGGLVYWRFTSYDGMTAGSCSQDGCIGWMER